MLLYWFYFPSKGENEHGVKLECNWSDKNFKYVAVRTLLALDEVRQELLLVLGAEREKVNRIANLEDAGLTLPLTPSYVKEAFGLNAIQVCSGQSVVIINDHDNKVYKHPLTSAAYQVLDAICFRSSTNVVFPTEKILKKDILFFVFPSYNLPKSIQQIQDNIVSFVGGVVSAIEELHAMGRAHLHCRY